MKKILLLTLTFATFITFQSVNAAPKCKTVGGKPVNAGDPACYTSVTNHSTITCTWSYWGNDCASPDWSYAEYKQGGCPNGWHQRYDYGHALIVYRDSCAGTLSCNNPNSGPPSSYTKEITTTTNTCYYLTVDSWSTCDEITGLQSATSVTQHSTRGKKCDDLNEKTTRSCGVCNDEPTSPPYNNIQDACKFGVFHSVQLFGGPPNGTLKWMCGSKGMTMGDVFVGDFFAKNIKYGNSVGIDAYAPTDKVGDQWCKCDTENKYVCVPGVADCTNKCGQKVNVTHIAYIEDTKCFPGIRKQITKDEYYTATGKHCAGTYNCPPCGAGENNTQGGSYHETNF